MFRQHIYPKLICQQTVLRYLFSILTLINASACFPYDIQEEIPVIFVFAGYAEYLKHTLWQAKQYNNRVILISDNPRNTHGLDVEYHDIALYNQGINQLTAPLAKLAFPGRIRSIQRWFVLADFMEKNGIDTCLHCDCDAMVYINATEAAKKFEPFDLVLVYDEFPRESELRRYTGCNSFCTLKAIKDFCTFMQWFYTDQENWNKFKHLCEQQRSLMGDMLFWTSYVASRADKLIIKNMCSIIDETTFDSFITSDLSGQFSMKTIQHNKKSFTIKDLVWQNNQPYCYHKELDKIIQFNSLHCQSNKKFLLPTLQRPAAG